MRAKVMIILMVLLITHTVIQADVILNENFEGTASGWIFGTSGEENVWEMGSATFHNGSKSAYISNDNGATASYRKNVASTSWLEKSVNLSGYSNISLSFYWKCLGQSGTVARDYGEVYVNNGSNHLVSGLREFVGQPNWTQKTIDLSSYAGQTITLKFKWDNNSSAGDDPPFCVDDILITGTANHDFATLSHSEDSRAMQDTIVYVNDMVPIRAVVKNLGDIAENAPVKWLCDGGTPTSDSNEFTSVLSPDASEVHNFSPAWTAPSTPGTFTLKIFSDLSTDTDTANDTTYIEITVLEVQSVPYSQNFDSVISMYDLPEGWSKENTNNEQLH